MNKRNSIFLLLILLFSINIFAQFYWEEIYTNSGNDTAVDIVDNQDGTYTIVGESASSGTFSSKDIWLYSINGAGEIIWEQTFGVPNQADTPSKIIRFNNEYWITSTESLYRTDLDGNVLGSIAVENGFDIIPSADNTSIQLLSFVAPQPLGLPRVKVSTLDLQGNTVSSFIVENDQIDGKVILGKKIIATTDGNYVIMASNFSNYEDTFYKITPTGTILWKKTYNWGIYGEPTSLFETSTGDFLVAGFYVFENNLHDHAYLLDLNGDLVWQNRFNISNEANGFSGTATSDGNYVFASTQFDTINDRRFATAFKINPLGEKIWQQNYNVLDNFSDSKMHSVIETANNDLIIVGTQIPSQNNQVAIIVRTNASGILLASCTDERINLNTQAEIDAFPGCVEANQIWISGDDITDLSPLNTLLRVDELVISSCPNLQNLNGLENLTTVDSTFVIINDTSLVDISALSNLTTSRGFFYLSGLTALPNLNGLQNLTMTDFVYLEQNNLLANYDELQGIQQINQIEISSHENLTDLNLPNLQNLNSLKSLRIINNAQLINITGFENIETFEDGVIIAANQSLTNINWLSSIQSSEGLFVVASNASLTSLDGLENLTALGNGFELSNNASLLEVNALSNLMNVSGNFNFLDNTALQDCCGLYSLLAEGTIGSLNISGNSLCNSQAEILFECQIDDCDANVTLTSQAEVDAYIGCTSIAEVLTIDGDDIVDLSPLSDLQEIGAVLAISNNPILTSLAGLNNLQSVGFTIILDNNPLLNDISALSNLETLQGQLSVTNNAALSSLEGFNNLETINDIIITENAGLTDISALNQITTLGVSGNGGFIIITENNNLPEFNAFNQLINIPNQLIIAGNNSLQTLNAFQNTNSVGAELILTDNISLNSLNSFQNIQSIGTTLYIHGNDELQNIDELGNLMNIGGSFEISFNTELSDCCGIYPLLNEGNISGNITITDNPSPCSNQAQVLSFCDDGVLDGVDLKLEITADRAEYAIYRDIVYTVSVTNEGTADATNVRVSVPKAAGFNNELVFTGFRDLYNQGVSYQSVIGTINIATVPVGETIEVELVLFPLVDDQAIDLFGQIIAQNQPDVDSINDFDEDQIPDEDDEFLVTVTPVNSDSEFADLEMYISADIPFASIGDEVTYTISVTNKGETNATGVRVSHLGFFGQNYLTHTTNSGSYENFDQLWQIGNLDVGSTVMLNVTTVINSFPLLDDIKMAAFQVQTADQNDRDSSPGNAFTYNFGHEDDEAVFNVKRLSNEPTESPDLELNLTVDNTEYTKFSYVTYNLIVTNTGTAAATGVKIDWQEPEGLAYHEAIVSNGRFYSWSGEWFIDTPIEAGASENIEFTLWTNVGGVPITSYAQVVEMNESDTDSFAGNGTCCVANEDDEAAITIGGNGIDNNVPILGLHTENTLITPATISTNKGITHQQLRKIVVHNIFPNPATDYVKLGISTTIEDAVPFSVYNASGIIVQNGQLTANDFYQEHRLNIEDLPSGLYIVRFHTGEDHAPVRFMKQLL